MEVRPGYRQTEVGAIPKDWQVESAAHFATILTGPFGTLLKASEYSENDGVPVVSVGEIREGVIRITPETPCVPSTVTKRLSRYLLKRGDIVFGRKGGVDRSALVREAQEGWFLGSDGLSLRPFAGYSNEYLAAQFQGRRVQDWLLQRAIGTTMPSLNQDILSKVTIPIPPTRTEQEVIAGALLDAEALIESLEQLLAKKRDFKQGAIQRLFRPRPGWSKMKLGSVGPFLKGRGIRKHESASGKLPCVRYGEIYTHHNCFVREFYSWISSVVAAEATRLKQGDILFAGSGETLEDIGKSVAFISDCEAYAGGDIVILRPERADALFLGYYLNSAAIARQKASRGQGELIVHIGASALADIDITVPSDLHEQAAIARVLFEMDAEVVALSRGLAKIRLLKQGMMQELLTGRIRLV